MFLSLNTPSTQQLMNKCLINKLIEELGEVQWEMQARPRDRWPTFCGHSLPTSQSPNVSDLITNSNLRMMVPLRFVSRAKSYNLSVLTDEQMDLAAPSEASFMGFQSNHLGPHVA